MTTMGERVANAVTEEQSGLEAEIAALQAIYESFTALDSAAQRRVMEWTRSRYDSVALGTEAFNGFLKTLIEAVAEHQSAKSHTANAHDRVLWEKVLKGTKFWKEPESPR